MLGRRTGFAWLFLVACSSSSAAPGDDAPRGSDAPARDAPATIFPDPGATPPGSIPDAGPVADPVSREGDGDFVIGPSYADAPEYGIDGLPKGQISSVRLESFASRIYPSNIANGRRFQRDIWTYLPAGYVPGTEVPFMIAQDGGDERDRLPPILDVLIAQKRLPPMVVVMINPGPGDGPGSQRGLEYDRVSPDYGTFIETEILPFLAEMYQIKFTTNP